MLCEQISGRYTKQSLEECISEETRIEKSREVFARVLAPWAYGSGFESNLPYQLCLVETVFVKISLIEPPDCQLFEVNPSFLAFSINRGSELVICNIMIRGFPLMTFLQAMQCKGTLLLDLLIFPEPY